MPRISIVIPTYSNTKGLRECLQSVVDFTDLADTEIIVVANGAPTETKETLELYRYFPVKLIWVPEAIGYTKATNIGIKAALETECEYVILMNDDVVLLSQYRDAWKRQLLQPFDDPKMAITGPVKHYCHAAEHEFLIFFLVMIRRSVLDDIGILDEVFSPGSGEDTDWCIRALARGYKMQQTPPEEGQLVPKDSCPDLPEWKKLKMWSNQFPAYHDGNATFSLIPEIYEPAMQKNHAILTERYGKRGVLVNSTVKEATGICAECGGQLYDYTCVTCVEKNEGLKLWRAGLIDGWFGLDEGRQLAEWVSKLPKGARVCEIGSWHGRSSRFIADNLPEGGQLWCVDTWIGSSGEPEMHGSAHHDRGDHAHQWWWCNLQEHIMAGRVVPVRMHSENAAHTIAHLIEKGQMEKFDLIFIDGDHSEEGIKTDGEAWLPLLKEGGLICGHDYYKENEGPHWVFVRAYVEAKFPNVQKAASSLWYVRPEPRKVPVFDCFPFNDELDLLELRLQETDSVVDRWIITEAPITHSGVPKPLYFKENQDRFKPWLSKITHIIVDNFEGILDLPDGPDKHWAIERHQRNALMMGLVNCQDDDIILIGDCDEIPKAEAIASYRPEQGLTCLEMSMHYGYMNLKRDEPWLWSRLLPYGMLKTFGDAAPCVARYNWNKDVPNYNYSIPDGGWHFSFMGGPDEWVRKLEATPHQEYNKPEFKDKEILQQRALNGEDILGRGEKYNWVEVDDSFPKFVRENIRKFVDNKFLYEAKMHPESWQFIDHVRWEHREFFTGKKVLEVGSLDINGSVRQFFDNCDYEGIDIAEGKGVDRVVLAHQFFRDEAYDVVISSEMLEHDQFWFSSLKQMYRNLKPGGLMIITCAGPNRPEHGTARTNDAYSSPFTAESNYYQNLTVEDFQKAIPLDLFADAELMYARKGEDLYFRGIKPAPPVKAVEPKIEITEKPLAQKKHWTVTAEVSTKDRYHVLPLALSAIINQTHKPDKLIVYDDGDSRLPAEKLCEMSPFEGLFKLATDKGIEWSLQSTPRSGQVTNHQHCLDTATTDFIWRVDDDEIPEPNCLEVLLNTIRDYGRGDQIEKIGAVGGLVHHPASVSPLPPQVNGSLGDISLGLNLQWFQWNGSVKSVDHLYSTFLYSVKAAREAGGYPKDLSPVGHREETIFSHQLTRAGYKVLVTPYTKTYHLRENSGGIRSFHDDTLWQHDEQIFQSYLKAWDVNLQESKLVVLDMGLGDHLIFKAIFGDLRRRHPDKRWTLAVCHPDVFKNEDVTLISIADAKLLLGNKYDEHSVYRFAWNNNFEKPMNEVMMEFWG